jgi:hypothetical protein
VNNAQVQLRVRGKDPYEMGRSAAQASPKRAVSIVRALARWARSNEPVTRHLASGRAPELGARRELEGAAWSLGLAPEDLLAARRIVEGIAMPACTNFGATGPATADGDTILSWNFDVPPYFRLLFGKFPMFVRELEGEIPYLCLGVPALVGIGVMNAEGLTCVVNAVGLTDDGEGLSAFDLNNKAMGTCSTVDEVEKIYLEGPRGAVKSMTYGILQNFNTIWADSGKNLSLFEYSHNYFNRHDATTKGSVASANHHQYLDRKLAGTFDPDTQPLISGSYSRLGRMYALLDEYRGRVEPSVVKRMVSDHVPDYSLLEEFGIRREWWEEKLDDSTICAHAWNVRKHLARFEIMEAAMEVGFSTTVYSLQFQPEKMTSWFTDGHPCMSDAIPVYWGGMLGKEEERYPGAREPQEIFTAKRQTQLRSVFRSDRTGYERTLGVMYEWLVRAAEKPNFK